MYKNKKLPVWVVVKRSYGYAWEHRALLTVPFGLLMVLQILSGMFSPGVVVTVHAPAPIPISIDTGRTLLTLVATLPFTVGVHRTVLLDEVRRGAAFLRWDRYLWHSLKTALFAIVAASALAALFAGALILPLGTGNFMALSQLHPQAVQALLLLAGGATLYFVLRFSLAFPAAALGFRGVFYLSWQISKGNALRLLTTILLVDLPFALPGLVLIWVLKTGPSVLTAPQLLLLFWLPLGAVLNALSLLLPAIAISLSFFLLFKVSDEFGVS